MPLTQRGKELLLNALVNPPKKRFSLLGFFQGLFKNKPHHNARACSVPVLTVKLFNLAGEVIGEARDVGDCFGPAQHGFAANEKPIEIKIFPTNINLVEIVTDSELISEIDGEIIFKVRQSIGDLYLSIFPGEIFALPPGWFRLTAE